MENSENSSELSGEPPLAFPVRPLYPLEIISQHRSEIPTSCNGMLSTSHTSPLPLPLHLLRNQHRQSIDFAATDMLPSPSI